jgi:hypothetical protein
VIEKKNQVAESKVKPGDITVQQYHRGFATSAFDVTITHPLQQKFLEIAMEEAGVAAEDAHDRKLQKSLKVCEGEGIHFVHWLGNRQEAPLKQFMRRFASGPIWKVPAEVTQRT